MGLQKLWTINMDVVNDINRILSTSNPYIILQVSKTDSLQTIRKKYRMLARKLHPDKCSHKGAHQAFTKLNNAYQQLQNLDQNLKMESNKNTNPDSNQSHFRFHSSFSDDSYYESNSRFFRKDSKKKKKVKPKILLSLFSLVIIFIIYTFSSQIDSFNNNSILSVRDILNSEPPILYIKQPKTKHVNEFKIYLGRQIYIDFDALDQDPDEKLYDNLKKAGNILYYQYASKMCDKTKNFNDCNEKELFESVGKI